ncbi:MAG TPA: hypothetical protein VEV84_06740 [Pyrinomonadaceae bacterium]|nr:hypothetical protein [Pyrinomonadaceae bacterium]
MTYEVNIEPKPGYIHVTVTGDNTKENVAAYLDRILQECLARNCDKVLMEEHLVGTRLSLTDVFEVVSEGSRKALGALRALAYVDINAVDDTMHFAETVAVNRAMPVRIFPTVEEAEAWISTKFPEDESVH